MFQFLRGICYSNIFISVDYCGISDMHMLYEVSSFNISYSESWVVASRCALNCISSMPDDAKFLFSSVCLLSACWSAYLARLVGLKLYAYWIERYKTCVRMCPQGFSFGCPFIVCTVPRIFVLAKYPSLDLSPPFPSSLSLYLDSVARSQGWP